MYHTMYPCWSCIIDSYHRWHISFYSRKQYSESESEIFYSTKTSFWHIRNLLCTRTLNGPTRILWWLWSLLTCLTNRSVPCSVLQRRNVPWSTPTLCQEWYRPEWHIWRVWWLSVCQSSHGSHIMNKATNTPNLQHEHKHSHKTQI